MNIGIILLAAGSSTRMGQPKQLLDIAGKPLIAHAIDIALQTDATNLVVVLGANPGLFLRKTRDLRLHYVVNENWQRGMGSSLKAGLNHLFRLSPDTDAVLVMVADQPLVTPNHLTSLMTSINDKHQIAASHYNETIGVPVAFGKIAFPELFNMEDQTGAKKILTTTKLYVNRIDFPGGAIDLDTPEDYQAFLRGPASEK